MRRALACALVISTLGCGGKTAPAGHHATEADAKPGTSGYPGLDWGASMDDVKAMFPLAAPGSDNLSITGDQAGLSAVTTFQFNAGKLWRISVSFSDEYPSMGDCLKAWGSARGALDGKLGASKSENGAAYWDSASYNVELSCDPGDEDAGVLGMIYAQPQP